MLNVGKVLRFNWESEVSDPYRNFSKALKSTFESTFSTYFRLKKLFSY